MSDLNDFRLQVFSFIFKCKILYSKPFSLPPSLLGLLSDSWTIIIFFSRLKNVLQTFHGYFDIVARLCITPGCFRQVKRAFSLQHRSDEQAGLRVISVVFSWHSRKNLTLLRTYRRLSTIRFHDSIVVLLSPASTSNSHWLFRLSWAYCFEDSTRLIEVHSHRIAGLRNRQICSASRSFLQNKGTVYSMKIRALWSLMEFWKAESWWKFFPFPIIMMQENRRKMNNKYSWASHFSPSIRKWLVDFICYLLLEILS